MLFPLFEPTQPCLGMIASPLVAPSLEVEGSSPSDVAAIQRSADSTNGSAE